MKTEGSVLTQEERDVLIMGARRLGAEHVTNREIGQHLGISVSRVKTLLHQACLKLGADNRNEAILLAMYRGEIRATQLVSLEEQAEILSSVGPDVLRQMASRMRLGQEHGPLPGEDEPILFRGRRDDGRLTNREHDVLVLVAQGLTNQKIADRLCMSLSAVKTFLYRASAKLGTNRRADAVRLALKQREIAIGEIWSLGELLRNLAPFGSEDIEKMADLLDERSGPEPGKNGG